MRRSAALAIAALAALGGCLTGEEEFVDGRLLDLCNEGYWICNTPAGCVLDHEHYVEGVFPGVRRVVVATEQADEDVRVRLYFSRMRAPGTELLVQLYESDCTLDPERSRAHLLDVDVFDEAGDDRTLMFDLTARQPGEHLLEIYSDASADYLLTADVR